ncbi:MAG: hypothetical protein EZS28_029625, partial [Streblomastix strix]
PDQVTPASDAIPLVDSGTGVAGTSNEYSRGDHKLPLQVSDVLPSKYTSVGTVGQASSYARSDHQHPIQTVDTFPVTDSADGSYGTVDLYARNDHSHPINVQTNASIIPIVDGVGANGISAYYSRHDHVHPQQLTYDGNVTATKFIKSGGTSNEILLADGSTKKSVLVGRSFTVIDSEQYVKLCTIIAVNSITDNSIKFEVNIRTGFGQLLFNQHWTNGQGISEYQYKFIPTLATGINNVWILYFGSGVDKYGELWSLPTGYSSINQLFPNIYGDMQINPTGSNYSQGCGPLSTTGTQEGQWNILTPPTGELKIVVNAQLGQQNQGLMISADGQALTFNGNQFVDLTTDQSLAGIKTFQKLLQVNPTANGTFNEGIRISRHPTNQWSNIQFGSDPDTNSGKIDNQWLVGSTGNNGANPLGFVIVKAGEEGQANRGLQISADGNTLSFNGQVIAGGSVNYSQGSTILWGTRSLGTDGGFYTDGTTVFWRDHALQFDPIYQG